MNYLNMYVDFIVMGKEICGCYKTLDIPIYYLSPTD